MGTIEGNYGKKSVKTTRKTGTKHRKGALQQWELRIHFNIKVLLKLRTKPGL